MIKIDQEHRIADIEKNSRETVRVGLKRYNGHHLIDLRVFFQGSSGDLLPSGKGVSLNVERLAELRAALARAEAEAREMGWLTSEAAE